MRMTVANKLVTLRLDNNLTQKKVAEDLNISQSTYNRYEHMNSDPSPEVIDKICKYYRITPDEFYEISFPIEHSVTYPKALLNALEKAIEENGRPSADWNENKKRYDNLTNALRPVLDVRDEALYFPDIDISSEQSGTTVKSVKLDIRGEKLIRRCLDAQSEIGSYLFGGRTLKSTASDNGN